MRRVGVAYAPPGPNNPPLLVGGGADLFDIVLHMHGIDSIQEEVNRAITMKLGRVEVRVLPLERIIESKRAGERSKDRAILPVLEDTLRVLRSRS